MVTLTLDRMATGGMYDQLGGGFHRYSVDGRWHVPHFEKMLYDNAQLARLYLHAWQVTGERALPARSASRRSTTSSARCGIPTAGSSPRRTPTPRASRGSSSSGRTDELVDDRRRGGRAAFFGAAPRGTGRARTSCGCRSAPRSQRELGIDDGRALRERVDARARAVRARASDGSARDRRQDPRGWNGLAIAAFAEAGRVLGEPRYVDAAVAAAEFVLTELRDDGRPAAAVVARGPRRRPGVRRRPRDDGRRPASTLYETTFDPRWFREARTLADDLVRAVPRRRARRVLPDGRRTPKRSSSDRRSCSTTPSPSGNSVAAEVLQRLCACSTGDAELERAGVSALRLVREGLSGAVGVRPRAVRARPVPVAAARGGDRRPARGDGDPRALAAQVWSSFRPNLVHGRGRPGGQRGRSGSAPRGPGPRRRPPAAYVCERFACRPPGHGSRGTGGRALA